MKIEEAFAKWCDQIVKKYLLHIDDMANTLRERSLCREKTNQGTNEWAKIWMESPPPRWKIEQRRELKICKNTSACVWNKRIPFLGLGPLRVPCTYAKVVLLYAFYCVVSVSERWFIAKTERATKRDRANILCTLYCVRSIRYFCMV